MLREGGPPIRSVESVAALARSEAGIGERAQLERALAMLQRWGVLVLLRDGAGESSRVVQAAWCASLVYTLFAAAHGLAPRPAANALGAAAAGEAQVAEAALRALRGVDLEALRGADPGGRDLGRGLVSRAAAEAMFGGLAREAGLVGREGVAVCLRLLQDAGLVHPASDFTLPGGGALTGGPEPAGGGAGDAACWVVPSLFRQRMPPALRAQLVRRAVRWSTRREYRFNVLPHKVLRRSPALPRRARGRGRG
jgi:hypothetical protein